MVRLILAMFVTLTVAACSDDTTATNERPTCEFGQRYNVITGKCDTITVGINNTSTNNTSTNNTSTNNTSTNNTSTNNTSANNTTNNETNNASNNETNNTTPDMGMDMEVEFDMPPMACGKGQILGKACAPNGDVLATADVTVSGTDCATGLPFTLTARTSGDGTFSLLDVPSGQHNLNISIGSFSADSGVFVRANEVTDLTSAVDKICLDTTAVNIAVIGGAYDAVEDIIAGLNLTYDMKGGDTFQNSSAARSFLTNPTEMANYDIIFINCGDLYAVLAPFIGTDPRPQIATNLRNFVNNGGSLYASDYAYPWVELAFPDILDLYGNETTNINSAKMGYAPQTVTADVLSADLQTILGRNTATIVFPHQPPNVLNTFWSVLEGVGAGALNNIQANVQMCQNANNCGSANNTLHNNTPLLVTWKSPQGGTVVFTSFHNKRQATLNQDMEQILRYLIFQL